MLKKILISTLCGIATLFISAASYAGIVNSYQHCNYSGWSASLEVGTYNLIQLRSLGFVNDDASSIQVNAGYEVVLYEHDNSIGKSIIKNANDDCLVNDGFNDNVSSLVVRSRTGSSSSSASSSVPKPALVTKTFTPTNDVFPNPERGWLVQKFSNAMDNQITTLRTSAEQVSLVLVKVDIGAFRNSDHLSAAKLDEVRNALQLCRSNGLKAIMRSAYSFNEVLAPDPADINRMVNHVLDMKGIYHDYKDVIVAVEMGMFGPWGEMHSSSHSTVNTSLYYPVKTDALKIIHRAYMNALPSDRQVLIRRPHYIREIFGNSIPLTESEAYGASDKARTGYHNDAYLNSVDDGGTFAHGWNRQQELNYIHEMSRFTFFGGETFGTPNDTYNNANNALQESRYQHLSYLNRDYYTPIYDAWGSAKTDFTRNIGYRFVLNNVSYTSQVAPGGKLEVNFSISNIGFANLHNPRAVELVLDNGSQQYRTNVSVNPRTWDATGVAKSFTRTFHIPRNIAQGNWNVYLALPDVSPTLKNDPRYAIRFANTNTWDARGLNLLFSLPVIAGTPGDVSNENEFFEIGGVQPPVNSATLSANNLVLKGVLTSNVPYRHAYIDADSNAATGLSTQGMGADFLIENQNVYQHTGSGWSWTRLGSASLVVEGTLYTWNLPNALLNNSVSTNSKAMFAESDGNLVNIFSQIVTVKAN